MIALVGESASGKSSVEKFLINNFWLKKIVKYTTRGPRDEEIDGIDYHFINEHQFKNMDKLFAEKAKYNGWYYGTVKNDYIDSKNKICILTPSGIRQIKKNGIEEIYAVYIKVPRRDRLIKSIERGDNIEEAYRRNLSDVGQFDGIENEVDLVINNNGYKKTVKDIAYDIIHKFHESLGMYNAESYT